MELRNLQTFSKVCETMSFSRAAEELYITIGITERDSVNATLYCTNLIFAPDGTLAAKHRKLKPTGAEQSVLGSGCTNRVTHRIIIVKRKEMTGHIEKNDIGVGRMELRNLQTASPWAPERRRPGRTGCATTTIRWWSPAPRPSRGI